MIEATALRKRYGDTLAVDDLSFTVPPGQVTGFLGPNGSGKSTTMRMILGLDAPSSGSVTVNGRPYAEYRRPLFEVGALLEAKAMHGGRSAYNHLLCLALSNGIDRSRIDEVLDQVGLRRVARKRSGGFSLGMGQRLGIAAALLGDPKVLIFDEPVNGLDPEGVLWIRNLVKSLAAEGRTVFLSSHLMSEMSITADRLIIIGRGRLIKETTVADFLEGGSGNFVRVRSPQGDVLATLLEAQGIAVARQADATLRITGATCEAIGELARSNGFTLQELSAHQASLEETFMELTRDSVDYHAAEGDELAQAERLTPVMGAIATPQAAYSPLAGFADILRSELCKFRTVRSTYWTLFAAVAFNVVLAALLAVFIPDQLSAQDKATFDSTRVSLGGIHLSQIAFGVLGVLVITSEYTTGMIRATLSAVPQRRRMLAAKVIVFTVTALAIGILSCFAAYIVFQAFLSDSSLQSSLGDPGVLRAVIGGGLFLTTLGLLGLGLGAIIRASAGSIAAVLGLLFVPQILVALLPASWKAAIGPYVPMQAGSAIFSVHPEADALGPWTGFGVFCLYAAIALGLAFVLINRRDA